MVDALPLPDGFRLLVTGGRDYDDREHVFHTLDRVNAKRPIRALIHGAARGADSLADEWAEARLLEVWRFPAKWGEEGRAAGHLRNQRMLDVAQPQGVVALHPDAARWERADKKQPAQLIESDNDG